ncbi:MAG: type IV conjugative transfer system protein TraL [Alphaproteobacteria bacterium]
MEDYDQHILLHRLDDPLRLLFWTVDEAASILIPPFLGLGMDRPFLGLIGAGIGFFVLRSLKRRWGNGTLKHALYWHFPHNRQKLLKTPPSAVREYLG